MLYEGSLAHNVVIIITLEAENYCKHFTHHCFRQWTIQWTYYTIELELQMVYCKWMGISIVARSNAYGMHIIVRIFLFVVKILQFLCITKHSQKFFSANISKISSGAGNCERFSENEMSNRKIFTATKKQYTVKHVL